MSACLGPEVLTSWRKQTVVGVQVECECGWVSTRPKAQFERRGFRCAECGSRVQPDLVVLRPHRWRIAAQVESKAFGTFITTLDVVSCDADGATRAGKGKAKRIAKALAGQLAGPVRIVGEPLPAIGRS